MVYIVFLSHDFDSAVYLIYKAQMAYLKAENIFISILYKYSNFANIFLKVLVRKYPEYCEINDYAINLIDS